MPDASLRLSPMPRTVLRNLIARQTMPLAFIVVIAWLMRDRVADLDFGGILSATRSITPGAWIAAMAATIASFWAVGRYDAVIHRLLGTDVAQGSARRSGIVAIATAQTAGFGLLTGTLARWRLLPELSLWQSARVTVAVTLSFMAGLAVVAAVSVLWLGSAAPVPPILAWVVLLAAVGFSAMSLWRPRFLLHRTFPPLKAQGAILALVALDTAAAALTLYVLLPAEFMPPAGTFYAVFLLALGAGLIGATPGGVGPFEYVCLAMMSQVPEASLLAAIAGYRLVYYGLPGALAAFLLVAGSRRRARPPGQVRAIIAPPYEPMICGSPLDATLYRAPRAEAQLMRQGELDVLSDAGAPVALASATGQSLIVLGDPLPRTYPPARLLQAAIDIAQTRCLTPCLYKCSARVAATARRAGWKVAPVSHEAWIVPRAHDVSGPQCRQLRRQLRRAEVAGLRTTAAGAFLPLEDMCRIAEIWTRQHGGARGFTLGRFSAPLLARQRVFLCYSAQRRLVAFVTFHVCRHEWTLDQMCQTDKTAPGAMHLLIASAIDAAARDGCPRLSLAAAPRRVPGWVPQKLATRLDVRSGAAGLTQFKAAFAPNWEPLYIASPTRTGLMLGSLDLLDRITRPGRRGHGAKETVSDYS